MSVHKAEVLEEISTNDWLANVCNGKFPVEGTSEAKVKQLSAIHGNGGRGFVSAWV